MRKSQGAFAALIVAILLFAGCVPRQIKEAYKNLPLDIAKAQSIVKEKETAYSKSKESKEWKNFFAPYAVREKWDKYFFDAGDDLADAQKKLAEIKPLMEKYRKENLPKISQLIGLAKRAINASLEKSRHPATRMTCLADARDKAPQMLEESKAAFASMDTDFKGLEIMTVKAQADYPKKKEDLGGRLAAIKNVYLSSGDSLKTVLRESASETPDYAIFYDNYILITKKNAGEFLTMFKNLHGKLGELYRSYSKVLVDMKADYYVQVGRTSWDESSDWCVEHDYSYPAGLYCEATWDYFEQLPETQTLAAYSTGFFGGDHGNAQIAKNFWDTLRVSWKENWPSSSDDNAEYWISDLPIKYYHKYIILENEVKKETDWQEVSEEVYEAHDEDSGMEIVSKPYGFYEEEKLTQASPVGLSKVGNEKYGAWKTDASGNSFWDWYVQYRFYNAIFGLNQPYYRDEWNSWNRDYRGRKAYYGSDDDQDQNKTRASGATMRSTGGNLAGRGHSQDPSVRGAGPATRSRGPGGGGK
jgi:hypothetical protein